MYNNNLKYIRQFPTHDDAEGQSQSIPIGIAVDKKNRVAVADSGRKLSITWMDPPLQLYPMK